MNVNPFYTDTPDLLEKKWNDLLCSRTEGEKKFNDRLTHYAKNNKRSEQKCFAVDQLFSTGTTMSLIPFIFSLHKTHHDKMIPLIDFNNVWIKQFAQMDYMYPILWYKW